MWVKVSEKIIENFYFIEPSSFDALILLIAIF